MNMEIVHLFEVTVIRENLLPSFSGKLLYCIILFIKTSIAYYAWPWYTIIGTTTLNVHDISVNVSCENIPVNLFSLQELV